MPRNIHIAIVDCAIKIPSIRCFNRIVEMYDYKFSFHMIPSLGVQSLKEISADGYIVFGSYSNVHERLDWHNDLADFLKNELLNNKPVLGICFTHQLMADLFQAKVDLNENNQSYLGVREIEFLESHLGFKKGEKVSIFTAHSYEVKNLPKNFSKIATSNECEFDGLKHNSLPFTSFQGHPEASMAFVQDTINSERKKPLTQAEMLSAQKGGDLIIKNFLMENFGKSL